MNKSQDQEKSFFTKITSIFSKNKSEQNNSTDSLKDYAPSNQLMSEKNVAEIKSKVAETLEALQPRYPKQTPSIITSEEIQLSDRQKEILLQNGSIGIPFKDSEDELEWRLHLGKGENINVSSYTGEEFLMKKSDLYENRKEPLYDVMLHIPTQDSGSLNFKDKMKHEIKELLKEYSPKIPDNEKAELIVNKNKSLVIDIKKPLFTIPVFKDDLDRTLRQLDLKFELSENKNESKIQSIDTIKENKDNQISNPVFVIENLNITNEQRKNASKYEELGMNEDFVLTKEQSAKIPDEIGDLKLLPMDKQNLAMGEIRIERMGESYQIEDNKILKTFLNENLSESRVFINQNEVKFNKSNALEITSENQAKNISYLSKQMKYLGFKETPELKNELTSKVNSNADNFIITQSTDKNFFRNNEITFDLKFNKSKESEMYFLNSYDVKLTNSENAKNLTHNVDLKKIPFTHKEAVNLIEGRSVRTDVTMKNGDKESVFLNINFQKQLDNKKGFELNKFFQNYGTKTDEILTKSNVFIAENKEELKDRIIKSLEKGNVVPVLIKGKEGEAKNFNAVLNPEYKTLNLYDSKMQRVNVNESLANGTKVEKQITTTSVQQNNSRKI